MSKADEIQAVIETLKGGRDDLATTLNDYREAFGEEYAGFQKDAQVVQAMTQAIDLLGAYTAEMDLRSRADAVFRFNNTLNAVYNRT